MPPRTLQPRNTRKVVTDPTGVMGGRVSQTSQTHFVVEQTNEDLIRSAPKGYIARDISDELYREIVTPSVIGKSLDGGDIIVETVYRINNPQVQYLREGGVTMRIIDGVGVVHLVPGPGYRGANHRWQPRDSNAPVQF